MKLAVPESHLGDQILYKSPVGPIKNGVIIKIGAVEQNFGAKFKIFWFGLGRH